MVVFSISPFIELVHSPTDASLIIHLHNSELVVPNPLHPFGFLLHELCIVLTTSDIADDHLVLHLFGSFLNFSISLTTSLADRAFAKHSLICSRLSSLHSLSTCFHLKNKCPPSSLNPPHRTHIVANFIPQHFKFIRSAKLL